jgi:putative ABC transport system ATP-binding protein
MAAAAAAPAPEAPPTHPGEPIVHVSHLKHFFGEGDARTEVLKDINLSVRPGEIVIMTGPSGSGKTTILTLIGGLRTVQEGSVHVFGREMHGLSEPDLVQVRLGIGFIFQRHNLFESLTALQNVRMAQELKGQYSAAGRATAEGLLKRLGLYDPDPRNETDHRFKYPAQLSGGQRQRVAIARALVNRPKLILADEPTAALDERSGEVVIDLLKHLAVEEGCTSFVVTHDNRILNKADRIVNMDKGRIVSNVSVQERLFICESLRKCVSFLGLTPEQLTRVADTMAESQPDGSPAVLRYRPGESIVRQGDPGDRFYLIRHGRVSVERDDPQTGSKRLAVLARGDFFGEVALMTGEPRNATVRAQDEVEAYALDQPGFQAAKESSAPFIDQIRRAYFQR